MEIRYWNQRLDREETESVYGDKAVEMLYGSPTRFSFTDKLLAGKTASKLVGLYQDLPVSAKKIAPFIQQFNIQMDEFSPGPFRTFNDFFIRPFLPGKRNFPSEAGIMGAPAEARYLAFANADALPSLPIKGIRLDPFALLADTPYKERFRDGPCLLARLCPVDYHRFHFPDEGRIVLSRREKGKLHSVNPLALQAKPDLFLHNERQISILDTKNFGRMAYVEIGALCVGKIVQTHTEGAFKRGQEKGYFLFGGSTVVIYGDKNAWTPNSDLLERSAKGMETLVQLGAPIAKALQKK